MLSQAKNIEAFVQAHLIDVIDWRKDAHVSGSTDPAAVELKTKFNQYKFRVGSAHAEPPPGAPIACKSLGWIAFDDVVGNKHVIAPKSDLTLAEIAKHINGREFADALAAARTELAEASSEAVGEARTKFAMLAERARKHGIQVTIPDVASVTAPQVAAAPTAAQPAAPPALPISEAPADVVLPVLAGEPMIGLPIVFIENPGEGRSGMATVSGAVTRVWPDGSVGLLMFVDDHEVQHRPKVARRGTDAGNGRVHTHGCWDIAPWYAAVLDENRRLADRLTEIAAENAKLAEQADRDRQTIPDLMARMAAMEADRAKPQPKKPAAAKEAELIA
jgi:hypothetical protein